MGRPSGHHRNDITPNDFAPGWAPPESEATERLRERLPHIDQHLAHITWSRVDWMKSVEARDEWNFVQLTADLIEIFRAFVKFIRDQSIAGWHTLDARLRIEGIED